MKNILLLGFALLFFTACKTTYNVSAQNDLKGNWTLTDVSYSESGINVKSFGLMDAKCFKNSVWNFIPNNKTGSFETMSSNKCSAQSLNYKWYITPENQFEMKFLAADVKAKNILAGYVLTMLNQTENSFTLMQNASLDGELIQIKYQFIKNN